MNKVMLLGRLTKDPEVKYTTNSIPVCKFTLAVNRIFGNNQADFITCVAWKNNAENLARYLHKGSQLAIEGRIETRSWDDNNGTKRYSTEVQVEKQHFLDSKGSKNDSQANVYETDPFKEEKTPQDFMDSDSPTNDDLPF